MICTSTSIIMSIYTSIVQRPQIATPRAQRAPPRRWGCRAQVASRAWADSAITAREVVRLPVYPIIHRTWVFPPEARGPEGLEGAVRSPKDYNIRILSGLSLATSQQWGRLHPTTYRTWVFPSLLVSSTHIATLRLVSSYWYVPRDPGPRGTSNHISIFDCIFGVRRPPRAAPGAKETAPKHCGCFLICTGMLISTFI